MSRSLFFCTLVLLLACDSDKGVTAFNSKPEASITSHNDGDVVLEGYATTFRGSASDPNHSHDQLLATWYVGTEVLCEATVPESDGAVQCDGVLLPTDVEVRLEVKDAGNATGSASVALSVTPTAAPESQISAPTESGVYYSGQLMTFTGVLSDAEDAPELLTGYWESSLDGVLTDVAVTPNSEGEVEGFGYLTEGEHAIQLYVEDTTGKVGSSSVVLEVGPPNSTPLCEILTPLDGGVGTEGDTVSFTATVSDVDVPSDWLMVSWSSDKDGSLGESTPNTAGDVLFSFADLTVDTHTITMTVADEVGATCTDFISYTVGTPPEVHIDSPVNGDTATEGQMLDYIATVSDAQDQPDAVLLEWTLNGNPYSTQGATSTGTAQFTDDTLNYGSYTLVVTATDTDGLTDADQISFTVNGLPSAPLVSIEPDPAATNNALSASILNPSVDPEGATVTYSYVWLKDNVVQPSQTAQTVSAADTLKGEQWTVRVTPNDGLVDGPYGEATVSVQNTQPVVSSVGISPTSNLYNDSIYTCTATVIDPDETPVLSYQWALEGNPVGSNVNSLDLNGTGAMPDDLLSCTVTATDSDFATGVGSTSITLDNRAPVLSNLVIDPATGVTTSMALTCSVDVTDADGETLSSDFTWTVGTSTYVGPTLQLDPSMVVPNDAVVCTADVTDGYGGSDQASTSVVVVNTPPTVTAVTLNPSSDVRNGDTVTCLASTDDADNDPVTLSYAWTINGASAGTGATISLSTAVDGDLVQCQATALDSHGASGLGSAALTVDNTAPIVTSASINPTNPVSQTPTLTCTAVGMDADNDPVQFSYEWLIGTQSLSETSSTLAGPFPVSETVICRVTPNDGKSNGQPVDTSVTVDNTPPTVSSVTLSPGAVYTNDEIVAIAVFDDVDGQSVSASFDWHVVDFATGATTIVQSGPDTTLSGVVHFDRDDEVYVVVTPNDGVEDGNSMTSSGVTVLNTPPTAPSVSASPDPASAGQDDLVCTVDVPSTDADTDVVYYTYEWTDPTGAVVQTTPSTAALSDTFAGTSTTEGMWTCTVTPDDGLPLGAIGPSDSTMVTVGSDCLLNGMVLYLPFDNGGLTDQSHFVHSVIAELSSSTADRYQNPISAWNFIPDVNSRLLINSSPDLTFSDAFSFSMYVKFNEPWNFHSESLIWKSPVNYEMGVDQNDSLYGNGMYQLGFSLVGNGGFTRRIMSYSEISTWFHVTGTYDQGHLVLYLNGVEVDDDYGATSIPDQDAILYLGGAVNPVSGAYNRDIDDVIIHNCALSAAEVAQITSGDLDNDGFFDWQDCDDTDPNITIGPSGATDSCPGVDCSQILADGYSTGDGVYWIDPSGSGAFEAYCDMSTDGGGWTLIESYDFVHRTSYSHQPFSTDFPRNGTSPNWDDYRLSLSNMDPLMAMSSEVHSRCHRDFAQSQDDYIFADISLATDTLSYSIESNGINPYQIEGLIRGYDVQAYELWFYGEYANYHQHVDGSRMPQSASSEDNFGWADSNGTNTAHLCHDSAGETVWMVRRDMTDFDNDGYEAWADCDDTDPSIHPLAGDAYGDGIDTDCDGFDCEADFDGNGVYFNVCVDTVQLDQTEVESHCRFGNYDGVALPLSSSENDHIFDLSLNVWANKPVTNYSIRLGGTDAAAEGQWIDEKTGLSMTYFNWPSNGSEPNNGGGGEHCINMIGDISYNGLWQDLGCFAPSNAAYAWSCEKR